MDLNSFQRKAILFIFISILVGAVLLARKQPLKEQFIKRQISGIKKKLSPSAVPAIIDINTADIPLLTKLPGIGPGLAKQIVDYRDMHGPFSNLADLQKVPGIGPRRIERIKEKITLKAGTPGKEGAPGGKINLNTASAGELTTISGVGPKTAQAIINYRTNNGPFHSLEELMEVPRIGRKTYENLKSYLYVDIKPQPATAPAGTGKFVTTHRRRHEIDTSLKCPYCGKVLWEKGQKKRVFIRCPHCLRLLKKD